MYTPDNISAEISTDSKEFVSNSLHPAAGSLIISGEVSKETTQRFASIVKELKRQEKEVSL